MIRLSVNETKWSSLLAGPAHLFFMFRFEYLMSGPKSYRDFRETGPWSRPWILPWAVTSQRETLRWNGARGNSWGLGSGWFCVTRNLKVLVQINSFSGSFSLFRYYSLIRSLTFFRKKRCLFLCLIIDSWVLRLLFSCHSRTVEFICLTD